MSFTFIINLNRFMFKYYVVFYPWFILLLSIENHHIYIVSLSVFLCLALSHLLHINRTKNNNNNKISEPNPNSPRSNGSPFGSPRTNGGILGYQTHVLHMDVHYDHNGHRSPSSPINNVASLIENHDAPLTNNSNTTSSSSTTTTGSSSMTTDDGQRSPRWTPRNPVTGFGIDAPFRRPRKMDVNHRGQRHFCTKSISHPLNHPSVHLDWATILC